MTRVEQHNMVLSLRDYARKMSRDELFAFEMMMKRDKDDEDLDYLTQRKLEELHAKYIPKKSRKDLDDLWNKFTSSNPDQKK
ncbi:MAG: hypothetical protein WBD36_12320 [Bacteroidota bacterium]